MAHVYKQTAAIIEKIYMFKKFHRGAGDVNSQITNHRLSEHQVNHFREREREEEEFTFFIVVIYH